MSTTVTNYDGSIVSTPAIFVRPESVERLQAILQTAGDVPESGTRVGSYHSLTPCASSSGTIVDMKSLNRDHRDRPGDDDVHGPGGAGDDRGGRGAAEQNLQFILNIEIGNLTLGSAACYQTKDALDGVEFGQVNSYVTGVKWVSPTGTLEEASEATSRTCCQCPRQLRPGRHRLRSDLQDQAAGDHPLQLPHPRRRPRSRRTRLERVIATNQAMVAGRSAGRSPSRRAITADKLQDDWLADSRRFGWNFLARFSGARHPQRPLPAPR